MRNQLLPAPLRPSAVRRGVVRAYRDQAAHSRARREHDLAIESDPSFRLEHGLQVARSVDSGRGGCPYCAD
ncbi:MAG: hypothetical protein ABR947_13780 [Solirubrobacteraceae bacterium]